MPGIVQLATKQVQLFPSEQTRLSEHKKISLINHFTDAV